MQFTVSQVFNASLEASKAADYPSIRMFSVALNTSTTPVEDISSPMLPWTGASPTVSERMYESFDAWSGL